MPIIVACQKCSTRLSAPNSAAGKQVRCPKPGCGAIADVPAFLPAEEIAVVDAVVAPPKPRPRPVEDEDDDRPRRKRRRSRDDDDDYELDRPRRRRARSGTHPGVIVAMVLGSLVVLGGIGVGIYALVSKDGLFAKKAAPPEGWKQFTYEKDNFKAYFPSEPSVNSMDGFGAGFGGLNALGANVPSSFSMYLPRDLFAPVHASVIVVRYSSPLSKTERNSMRDAMLKKRDRDFGEVRDIKSVRWLGVDADEVVSQRNLARVALVGNTLYVAEIGASNGRATSAEENGFFDNFELMK
jgi:hypothetical protein